MQIDIPITFINDVQSEGFYLPNRHQLVCGGFGSGKTYLYCLKALSLLTSFNGYRLLIGRQTYKTLKQTTLKTFFKVCPRDLYAPPAGRWNEQDGYLRLINGSEVLFVHLDEIDEEYLRGLEINACLLDQAEEISESTADILAARCGRWDRARPNDKLLAENPQWPMKYLCNKCKKGHWLPNTAKSLPCPDCGKQILNSGVYYSPTYVLNTCNPESETHWLYRYYHPDSTEKRDGYIYREFPSTENPALDPETLQVMLSKDPAWVKRFVYGKWGISDASIHRILSDSVITPSDDFIKNLLGKASLCRVLDHGDASPTACIWFATYQGQYFAYREYYKPGELISNHRKAISAMSGMENYTMSIADPSIFKKAAQKNGGFWSVADEYADSTMDSTPIFFIKGDNDELSTRNRINELLALDKWSKHPLTGESPAPRLYFIQRSNTVSSNFGVGNIINETRSQRRKKLSEINGKPIYSDEREGSVADHAYDCLRYFVASHLSSREASPPAPRENSFLGIRNRVKAMRKAGIMDNYGMALPMG